MRGWRIPLLGGVLFVGELWTALRGRHPLMARVWGPLPLVPPALLGVLVGLLLPRVVPVEALVTPGCALGVAVVLLAGVRLRLGPAPALEQGSLGALAAPLAAGVLTLSLTRALTAPESWLGATTLGMEQAAMGVAAVAFVGLTRPWIVGLVSAAGMVMLLQVAAWIWGIGLAIAEAFSHLFLRFVLGIFGLGVPEVLQPLIAAVEVLGLNGLLYGAVVGAAWLAAEGAYEARLRGQDASVIRDAWQVLHTGRALR